MSVLCDSREARTRRRATPVALMALLAFGSISRQGVAQEDTRYPAPDEGSMRSLIQDSVGVFELANVKWFPGMIREGAADAVVMLYRSADGVEVNHLLAAFPSPETSGDYRQRVMQDLVADGWEATEVGSVRNESGEEIGGVVVLGGPATAILWTNGNLFMSLVGPHDVLAEFYKALPY